jgi:proline iminopeptidase
LFKPVFGPVAEFAQVVYLDQRGSGRSDRGEPGQWTWERWADDIVDFCDALDVPRKRLPAGSVRLRSSGTSLACDGKRGSKLLLVKCT